ncbi:MAG: ferredoxin--NADP reductase [Candidatus Dadabacteria bacterium]|nr:MAG: ferredoxin--NADP reductase [Candidatus Dadabacteria bacterium]
MLNATLIKRIEITKELLILHIKPDEPLKPFLPGQYVALGLPGSAPRPDNFPEEKNPPKPDRLIKRAYSIGSSPENLDWLEFYIAVLPEGLLTSRLALLQEGDRLWMAKKITGTFVLTPVPDNHNLILVSTGTGIAPYISMLRTQSTWTAGRKITLLHGVRYSSDLAYRDELLKLARQRESFSYYPVISRKDPNWHGERGYVQKFFEEALIKPDPSCDHIFLCGNPAMIADMQKLLTPLGYKEHTRKEPGNLHVEKYW